MFNATILDSKTSQSIIGGMIGPYGECFFYDDRANGVYGWYRNETDKSGMAKECDEK